MDIRTRDQLCVSSPAVMTSLTLVERDDRLLRVSDGEGNQLSLRRIACASPQPGLVPFELFSDRAGNGVLAVEQHFLVLPREAWNSGQADVVVAGRPLTVHTRISRTGLVLYLAWYDGEKRVARHAICRR